MFGTSTKINQLKEGEPWKRRRKILIYSITKTGYFKGTILRPLKHPVRFM